MLDRKQTCDELVQRFAKNELIRTISTIHIIVIFLHLSRVGKYMAIEKVRQLLTSDDYDLVALDTPPATPPLTF